jgi:hypothetical protein
MDGMSALELNGRCTQSVASDHAGLVRQRTVSISPRIYCNNITTFSIPSHPICLSSLSQPIIPAPAPAAMSSSAQQTFRSQLSGFRWANSVQDDSPSGPAASSSSSANPFSRAWTGISGYIPLRNEGRSQEEEAYFALSVSSSFHATYEVLSGGLMMSSGGKGERSLNPPGPWQAGEPLSSPPVICALY